MNTHSTPWSPSGTEAKARAKRQSREKLIREQKSRDNERLRQEQVPKVINGHLDKMCSAASTAHTLWIEINDLNEQLVRFVDHNKSLDDPKVTRVIFWMICLGSILPIALIDYFLLNGFSTYLISVGGTAVESLMVPFKIAIVLSLIWVEIVIGHRAQREDGTLPWHAFSLALVVAVITGMTFLLSVSSVENIDPMLMAQIFSIMAVAFICHALCIRIAPIIINAVAWLKYRRLRKKTTKTSAKLLPAIKPVYLEYLAWKRMHLDNNIEIEEDDLPSHVKNLLRLYSDEHEKGTANQQHGDGAMGSSDEIFLE